MSLPSRFRWLAVGLLLFCSAKGRAIEVVVDYTYDTQTSSANPNDGKQSRQQPPVYSRIITSSLLAAEPTTDLPWRIGFSHPGTGEIHELSTAANADADLVPSAADEYGFEGLEADEWILFVGGRDLASAGIGGTATGTNFTSIFDDPEGPLHRGVIPNTPGDSNRDIPAWGGAVTFDIDHQWHFDLSTPSASGTDFYTIALHEIGHVLGLSTSWNQWTQHIDGANYAGENAVAAYNRDNGSSETYLAVVSDFNPHWADDRYDSKIFAPGEPNLVGTVGLNGMQDLLLEPRTTFSGSVRRVEVTNVDAAALVDVGWSILEEVSDPLDLNGDQIVDAGDLDQACATGAELAPWLERLNTVPGDVDLDGTVAFSDFLQLSRNFNSTGTNSYTDGDLTCDGSVTFPDFLALSRSFGDTVAASSVPEPNSMHWVGIVIALIAMRRRR